MMLRKLISREPVKRLLKSSSRFCSSVNAESECTSKPFVILGIETSCDDTGIGIVNSNGDILGEATHSQEETHTMYGGILPYRARDMHKENITKVCEDALRAANIKLRDIDAIATTIKPGLPLSLSVGIEFGKYLSNLAEKPFIPIHHMKAHALAVRMVEKVEFPYLVLLISGGHSLLAIAENVDKFYLLGSSFDDAAGEAMDKIARRLKLTNIPELAGYRGGRAIELAAKNATDPKKFSFQVPLLQNKDCNFSFSGLKNLVQTAIIKEEETHKVTGDGIIPDVNNICHAFQTTVCRHLCHRVLRAMEFVKMKEVVDKFPGGIKDLVVSGGVASNEFISNALTTLCQENGYNFHRPPPILCTDNGVMIAWNGVEKYKINSEVLRKKEEIDKVDLEHKCLLGEDWRDLVSEKGIKCKVAKI